MTEIQELGHVTTSEQVPFAEESNGAWLIAMTISKEMHPGFRSFTTGNSV